MLTFNTDGMVVQRFPFPAPIMEYIFKNLQPEHLLKLYPTCKFFYAKYGLNIIRHLEIVDDNVPEKFDPIKTTICYSNPALEKLKDFWIADSFFYQAPSNWEYLLPSFSNSTIKKLEARDHLVWNEYEALTRAGTIEELKIGEVYRDADLVAIEELIAQVPNATSIEFTEATITPTTFSSLAPLDHKGKITNFVLKNIEIDASTDITMVFNFLNKHADADCNIQFEFKKVSAEIDEILHLNEQLEAMESQFSFVIAAKLRLKKYLALDHAEENLADEESAVV